MVQIIPTYLLRILSYLVERPRRSTALRGNHPTPRVSGCSDYDIEIR
jgi:hypothetical protein